MSTLQTQTIKLPFRTPEHYKIICARPLIYDSFYSKVRYMHTPRFMIPAGRGKPSKPVKKDEFGTTGCGTFRNAYSCECRTISKAIIETCKKISCPICYWKGINRSADRVAERYRKIYLLTHDNIKHYSLNILDSIETIDDYKRVRRKINRILKMYGMSGYLIFHGHRKQKRLVKKKWKTQPNRLKIVQETNRMNYFPHFHFVGSGYLPNQNVFLEKHGFGYSNISYKNKQKGKKYKLKTEKAFKRLTRYLLSHTSVIGQSHTITWLGRYSYNSLVKTNIEEKIENVQCDNCLSFVYRIADSYIKFTGNYFNGIQFRYPMKIKLDKTEYLRSRIKTYELKFRKKKT